MLNKRLRAQRPSVHLVSSTQVTTTGTTITFGATTAGDIGVLFTSAGTVTVTGWTKLDSGSVGALFVKEMTAGETSAVASGACFVMQISFFRGAVLPTATEADDTAGFASAPNPPASPITVERPDVLWIGGVSDSAVATSSISSGYTLLQVGNNSWGVASGFITGQVGSPDPGAFGWSASADCNGFTLVLQRK